MSKIEIVPLGGIGEFGMNCMGIRYDDEMIIVDAGMGFPEETPYGVDISIPNFDFLEEYRDDITAIILTHGHEDHIGALPYILRKFNVPVYASRFTLGLADRKLEEFGMLDDVLLHRVKAGDRIEVGVFGIEFIHASHSLVECFSLAVHTPAGTLVHTGDYKIDDTPVIGRPYDLEMLGRVGDEGVLALLCDSTNATVPGQNAIRTGRNSGVRGDISRVGREALRLDVLVVDPSASDNLRYRTQIRPPGMCTWPFYAAKCRDRVRHGAAPRRRRYDDRVGRVAGVGRRRDLLSGHRIAGRDAPHYGIWQLPHTKASRSKTVTP